MDCLWNIHPGNQKRQISINKGSFRVLSTDPLCNFFLYQIFTFLLNPKEFPMFVLHFQEIEKEIQI